MIGSKELQTIAKYNNKRSRCEITNWDEASYENFMTKKKVYTTTGFTKTNQKTTQMTSINS